MPSSATPIFRNRADSPARNFRRLPGVVPGLVLAALAALVAPAALLSGVAASPDIAPDSAGLAGFPQSWAVENVPHPAPAAADETFPEVAILLPGRSRAVHLRATAIVAARLGQLVSFRESQCRLEPIEAWKAATEHHAVILIARRDQLGGIEFPSRVAAVLQSLVSGQGVLAEFSHGAGDDLQRVLLLSGADDAGLEQAALTLGSGPALSLCASNPVVIERVPGLAPDPLSAAEPIVIESPVDVHQVFLGDRLARDVAYAVPAGPGLEEVRTLLPFWIRLGRDLPSSPSLWPEVVTYQRGSRPDARLAGRTALILGSVADWPDALPAGTRGLLVAMASPSAETVIIQGRAHPVESFEPTLVFAQMIPSPWAPGTVAVVAGGWKGYAMPALNRMLLGPGSPGELRGDLAAMDALGRGVACGAQVKSSESFAATLQRRIAPGQTVEQSARSEASFQARQAEVRGENSTLLSSCALALSVLVAARLWLMWEHSRIGRRSRQAEGPAGGPG